MAVEVEQHRLWSAEDLALSGAPEKFVELIDGELIIMSPAGKPHNRIAENLLFAFRQLCKQRAGLDRGGDNDGFLISKAPDTLLSPDVSLYRARPKQTTTWLEFAPELAVEILSPSNTRMEMTFKRHRYFNAGTEQFWMVYPEERRVEIYFRDERILRAEGDAVIEGEGIAEGLTLPLAELFDMS